MYKGAMSIYVEPTVSFENLKVPSNWSISSVYWFSLLFTTWLSEVELQRNIMISNNYKVISYSNSM